MHDNTLTDDNRDKFIQIAEHYGQQLKFYNVEELCVDRLAQIEEYFPQARESHFSIAMFYRFFIPSLLLPQGIEKAIYLDSDIIVNLDIAELWQIELDDKPLGAVPEFYQMKDEKASIERMKKALPICKEGFVKPEDGFFSGLLLMNLKVLRNEEANILAGMRFVSEHPQFVYSDQDILNYCFSTTYLKLPEKFNRVIFIARSENELIIERKIYHYAALWIDVGLYVNDPYSHLFMDYFIKTPWVDDDTRVALSGGIPSRKNYPVSVVIPLYNMAEYVGECLDSLLAQTFQAFEVIVVDDCSTDNSVAVVESYIPKFGGRLRLEKTEKNMGSPGTPRNIGLMLARGEYIQFMDADDMILSNAIETLYKAAILYDAEVVYTSSYYRLNTPNDVYLHKDGTTRKMSNINTELTVDDINTNLNRLLLEPGEGNFRGPCTKLVRRDLLIKNRIFFPNLSIAEDFIWNINLYCHARRFLRISTPFYFYRTFNSNSLTRTIRLPQEQCWYWLSSFVDFTKALYELEKEQEVLAADPEYCLMALKGHFAWCLNQTEEARRELDNKKLYKILREEFAKKFSYSSAILLPFLFSSINEKASNDYYIAPINKFRCFITARIDIKLLSTEGDFQIFSISDKKATTQKPDWFQKGGVGYVIQSYTGELNFTAKATVAGKIMLRLRGLDIHDPDDRTKRIPYWIDYTKLTINEKDIFDTLTPVWHDKSYRYDFEVKAGEEVTIKLEWLPHRSDT